MSFTLMADGRTVIDTAALAEAFGTTAEEFETRLHTGAISHWFERGDGDQDNRALPVFFAADSNTRVELDDGGRPRVAAPAPAGMVR
ncbi:DUF6522 family protein [Pontibaca methylaminivorans]|uniref:Uncharacterized protein n=1 Tax=Pontibaca methylaminivorans TaxID=515897 RepID=A0A1R3WUK5_9RHOB|nr:DUF6522 family protein [Pontibaca methylaminivorans]SIT82126.1 hypothetical protein SAMN05421849_1622 [Pontibaca methylaminivorans]